MKLLALAAAALAAAAVPALAQQSPQTPPADRQAPANPAPQPVPTPDTKAFAAPPTRVDDYVVGPNDLLDIKVFELSQLDRTVRVTKDGTISLPLLGQVPVGGLTPRGVEEKIAQMLRDGNLVRDPQVSVFVQEFVSRRVFVQGAVSKPGIINLLGDRTLLDVVGEAGGLIDRAGTRIYVVRPFASGGAERIEVDAERLVYQGDPSANLRVQPGDIVMVPYEQVFKVFVNGAVSRPGPVEYAGGEPMTVLQAVTAAGGGNDRANESRVQIIRRMPDGSKQLFKVNLKRVKRGKDEDMLLQRNDIVVVPESFF